MSCFVLRSRRRVRAAFARRLGRAACGGLASCVLFASGVASAQLPASPNWTIQDWQLASAGGPESSLGYAAHAALLWAGAHTVSPSYVAEIGFLGAHDPEPTNAPVVFSITPHHGPQQGGSAIALSGIHFDKFGVGPSFTLTIGGVPATAVTVVSNTQVTATAPPGAMGPANVVASTSLGSDSVPGGFIYTPAVVASPTAVPGGSIQVRNYGPLGALFDLWWSPITTFIPLPPYGTILIGPTPATKQASGFYTGPDGINTKTFPVPSGPGLSGLQVHFQSVSIVVTPTLTIQLTNRSTSTLL